MDDYARDLARAAGGSFTRAEAHRWGLSDNDLVRWTRAGRIERIRRGVYALPRPSGTPEQKHAERARAILRARRGARAAARSSLALAGLPLVRVDFSTVVLCGPGQERYRRGDVVTYPTPRLEPVASIDGTPTVTIETALFQTVARDGMTAAIVAGDAALVRGFVTAHSLERRRGELGRLAPRGSVLIASLDAGSESPGESLMRLVLRGLGYDVRTQVVITTPTGEFVGRVDALIDGCVIAEFDGAVKYDGLAGRDELVREKRREDALRALGYVVIRVTWTDLFEPGRLDAMVRQAKGQLRDGARRSRLQG